MFHRTCTGAEEIVTANSKGNDNKQCQCGITPPPRAALITVGSGFTHGDGIKISLFFYWLDCCRVLEQIMRNKDIVIKKILTTIAVQVVDNLA